jgi:signal-transduction protein with cAMP-binding, CBS, and nucleotidyltransferase domain
MKLDTSSLERIDSFPYRHKVAEVMSAPAVTIPPQATLVEAARVMAEKGISSIMVTASDDLPLGIVTERDVLRAVAQTGSIGMHQPLSAVMSSPVATVKEEALIFVALGRMDRLKIRHLAVVDRQGRAVGMVSARSLLKLRAGSALALGDEIASAPDAQALALAHAKVPSLAKALLEEGVEPTGIANVVSTVLRDITARAAELAELAMADDGWGGPPAPGCLLILGSGGRGESLFKADQDNAIIYDGGPDADPWYAEISRRICETLDEAGVPKCKGGVMCVNAQWRRSSENWKAEIDRWMREAKGEDVLNIDIFIDFKPVYGTQSLADPIRSHLLEKAGKPGPFLHLLASSAAQMRPPLGMFGRIKTQEGRFDIKLSGLLLLVGAVRVLALKHRIDAQSTRERLALLAKGGHMSDEEANAFSRLHDFMIGLQIRQQLADIRNGLALSNRVDPKIMSRAERSYLKDGFKRLNALAWVMQNALSTV